MSRMRHGFTLIEVALFLAVTGVLFAGIMVGTQNSIWQQRYNDTVQSFTNFLRNVYSEVSNPQSSGDGRSDQAIYGKLISFGQEYGLDGERLGANEQRFFVYDVVGSTDSARNGSVAEVLRYLKANVVVKDDDGVVIPVGIVESYSPIWSSTIETTEKADDGSNLFKGSILIVRHPKSGTINTLVTNEVININEEIREANLYGRYDEVDVLLTSKLGDGGSSSFKLDEMNFCINPDGIGGNGSGRRNIRIIKNARNSSGVEIISSDTTDNLCL